MKSLQRLTYHPLDSSQGNLILLDTSATVHLDVLSDIEISTLFEMKIKLFFTNCGKGIRANVFLELINHILDGWNEP